MSEFRAVELPSGVEGSLVLHSMPGRKEAWPAFLIKWDAAKVDAIACLVSREEAAEKSPNYAEALNEGSLKCEVLEFGIPDFSVPDDREAFLEFVQKVASVI